VNRVIGKTGAPSPRKFSTCASYAEMEAKGAKRAKTAKKNILPFLPSLPLCFHLHDPSARLPAQVENFRPNVGIFRISTVLALENHPFPSRHAHCFSSGRRTSPDWRHEIL
jgi:hypothetical protein